MNAKQYLSQAYQLDQRVNLKLQHIASLRSLAENVTSTIRENVVSHTSNVTALEDTIIRIMTAESELNREIDALIDLKSKISRRIKTLNKFDHQLVLEKKYLLFMTWEEIAKDMHFSLRWVYSTHAKALLELDKIMQNQRETA